MKIIIDANCGHLVHAGNADGAPILKRLLEGKLRMCLSNLLKLEIMQTPVSEIYTDLALAGYTLEYKGAGIDGEQASAKLVCKSNDYHIIALAKISGCRLLFSKDKRLHKDFTNTNLVSPPRGKVYQGKKHIHLLP